MATVNALAISFLILCLSTVSITDSKGGFSLDLISRDSPKSPFYNPDETHHQRVTKALKRSVNRVSHFDPVIITASTAQADIISSLGEYMMNISIGIPPVEILAIADTGSDLIWTQCKPSLSVTSKQLCSLILNSPQLTKIFLVTQGNALLMRELPAQRKKLVNTRLRMA
ncbi:hypothetical protein KPL70_012288 [Citrus sinensis]|nr:hypothetical protein KPL70_012288 [Citrus sinensis]